MITLSTILRRALFVIGVFSLVGTAGAQGATLADGLTRAVLRVDEARIHTMLAPDVGALDDILASDCIYVHSNGRTQTKAQLLDDLRTGAFKYTKIRYTSQPLVRLYGSATAIITGTTQIEVQSGKTEPVKLTLLVTAVYVAQGGRWQLASYQSVRAAE
ncbi:MAG: nuclear transport factor 2 family protein [Candidatus Didemnitutus sp.]|nr:nuclear transport factor 2 family protein [Candidatus Didemnitutus sp.]